MLNSRWKAELLTVSSGATLVSTLFSVVSRTWSSLVKTLLRVSMLFKVASSIWCMIGEGAPLAGSGIQIPGGAGAGDMLCLDSSSCISPRWLSEKCLVQVFARAVRTWKYGALFPYGLVSGSHVFGVWVLHAEYKNWILREISFREQCLARHSIHVLPVAWSPLSRRMEKCAQQMFEP